MGTTERDGARTASAEAIDTWLAAIRREGTALAEAARSGPLTARVPTCPEWRVADLIEHVGSVHLWAAGHLRRPHAEPDGPFDRATVADLFPELVVPPEGEPLVDWYLATNENLVDVLRSAPADVAAWSFLPAPSPRHMWARRQSHETAIHRADAELAHGALGTFDPAHAADGVDEFILGFAPRGQRLTSEVERFVEIGADDTGDAWRLEIGPTGTTSTRIPAIGEDRDLAITGSASDLYLMVWNRPPDGSLLMDGDTSILERWRESLAIRW